MDHQCRQGAAAEEPRPEARRGRALHAVAGGACGDVLAGDDVRVLPGHVDVVIEHRLRLAERLVPAVVVDKVFFEQQAVDFRDVQPLRVTDAVLIRVSDDVSPQDDVGDRRVITGEANVLSIINFS